MQDKILIVSRNLCNTRGKRLADSFLNNLSLRINSIDDFIFTGLSCDQSIIENNNHLDWLKINRILSNDIPRNISLDTYNTRIWMGLSKKRIANTLIDKGIDFIRMGLAMRKHLENVDVVHWFQNFAPLDGIIAKFSKHRDIKNYTSLFSIYSRWPLNPHIMSFSLKNHNKIIISTKAIGEYLVQNTNIRYEQIIHIPLGIDLEFFKPSNSVSEKRMKAGLKDQPVVAWFGQIENTS